MIRRPSKKWPALALACATALTGSVAQAQYCPSYTASSPNNSGNCGVNAVDGTNPTNAEWADIFDLVSQGPTAWGNKGPSVPDIGQGCGKPETNHSVPARFPCELLKSIAKVESGWRQFCVPTTPSDQVGGASRTIISFDCGYGVGQVTSGMHDGENPDFDRQKVASDPTYNLATGTRILASKWMATQCVGDNQPTIVEDWYTATWAYNGLAYSNNPKNPNYASDRGVYDPAVNNPAPYQEKVFGWIENPSQGQWPSVKLAYPKLSDVGSSGSPPDLPEPSCASPTDCTDHRSVHTTLCIDQGTGGAGGSAPTSASAASSGSSVAESAASTSSGDTSAGGEGGSGDPSLDSTVCGCHVVDGERSESALSLTLLAAVIAFMRTKRRRNSVRAISEV